MMSMYNLFTFVCRFALPVLLIATLTACMSTQPEKPEPPKQALGNIEYHTSELADELFARLIANNIPRNNYRFAVATFVPVTSLKFEAEQGPLMLLGHQLEQGMITEASRRGFVAQDYKATNDIIIEKEAERVFSRNVDDLYMHHHNIDYYISGTITEQQNGATVNARIIDVETKDVIAAATRFFPSDLFWEDELVGQRHGMIYRKGSK